MYVSVNKRRYNGVSVKVNFLIAFIVAYTDKITIFNCYITIKKLVCENIYVFCITQYYISLLITKSRIYSSFHKHSSTEKFLY
ncbi:hypothetical protein SDC9_106246 [bioreactor metagenome]|uniref:Uncharacterized protein n=1 Tax=bioreactor metagenome TaxID=1076179 RepID=A0A645BCG8_9ZZZZ